MQHIFQILRLTLLLLLLCGILFPLGLTALSTLFFPKQAQGNLLFADGEAVGSAVIGQDFTADFFLKCRPSACNYNTFTTDQNGTRRYTDGTEFADLSSGSTNYAPSNPALAKRVEDDIRKLLADNPNLERKDIPADLVTASASGLDPHISPQAATIQLPAIAKASGIPEETLHDIVSTHTQGKLFGIFGEGTVNVLKVNLEIAKRMNLIRDFR